MTKRLFAGMALLVSSFLAHALLLTGILSIYSYVTAVPSTPISLILIFGLPLGVFLLGLFISQRLMNTGALLRFGFIAVLALCGLAQVALVPFWSCLVSRNFCL